MTTTILSAWALAAWLPHDHLRRRCNVISQPGATSGPAAPMPRVKPTPLYMTIYQFSRTGMVRLSWRNGLGGTGNQLDTDLAPFATIALKLPTVNQDRSWGRLPRILASDFASATPGGDDARGWPFLALWCEVDEGVPSGHTTRGGIALSPASYTTGAARILPYFPIWRGLIYDTVIYAAAWLVAIVTFRRVRAIVRRRRGLCPKCAYDRRGGPAGPCPECGREDRPRATESAASADSVLGQ